MAFKHSGGGGGGFGRGMRGMGGGGRGFGGGGGRGRGGRGGGRGRGRGGIPMRYIMMAAIAGGVWLWNQGGVGGWFDDKTGPERGDASSRSEGGWDVLEGAKLKDDRGNDGDSFLISHSGKTHHFRLYFVDSPEKYRDNRNGDRVQEQADYFDDLPVDDTVEIGIDAKTYAINQLKRHNFHVYTKHEQVYGPDRHYVMIELEPGTEKARWLCEDLVAEGLVRIYKTKGTTTPDGQSEASFERHLAEIEKGAQRDNAGGWAD